MGAMARVAVYTRAPERDSRTIQSLLLPPGVFSSPRQIWPPSAGLSSSSTTDAPLPAAAQAAAMPAGPAPAIRIEQCSSAGIGDNLHCRAANYLTGADMLVAINARAAFETDSHAAKRSARLARHRGPRRRETRDQKRRRGGSTGECRRRDEGNPVCE